MHFNHASELTPEVEEACAKLADIGIPLGSQTVLLKGVNDDSKTMKALMQKLLKNRIKPYYIYQADMTEGTDHLRTSVQKGLNIMKDLIGHTSGMAVPYYVIDAPGGGGKIRLLPNSVIEHTDDEMVITNYEGKIFRYRQPNSKDRSSTESSGNKSSLQDVCQLPV